MKRQLKPTCAEIARAAAALKASRKNLLTATKALANAKHELEKAAADIVTRGEITGGNELTRKYQLRDKLGQHHQAVHDATIAHHQAQSNHDCNQIDVDALEMQLRALAFETD